MACTSRRRACVSSCSVSSVSMSVASPAARSRCVAPQVTSYWITCSWRCSHSRRARRTFSASCGTAFSTVRLRSVSWMLLALVDASAWAYWPSRWLLPNGSSMDPVIAAIGSHRIV